MYNNKILKSLVNNDDNIHSDKVIHYFPGEQGVSNHKILFMTNFLNNIKNFTIINNVKKNISISVNSKKLFKYQNKFIKFNSDFK